MDDATQVSLSMQQRKFTLMVAKLIEFAYSSGYELTFGEAWRSQHEADWDASQGKGVKNSLHTIRLAVDLNLWKGGVYQMDSAACAPLGAYWESIGGSWGGNFSRPDGNHYSLMWQGVR